MYMSTRLMFTKRGNTLMYANMTSKFSNICRLCMCESESFVALYKDEVLPNRIMQLLPLLKIEVDDGLPSQICEICIHHIELLHNFKKQCEETEATFRSFLHSQLDCQIKLNTSGSNEVCEQNNTSEDNDPSNAVFVECKTELITEDDEDSVKAETDDNTSLLNDPTDNQELKDGLKKEKAEKVEGSQNHLATIKREETKKIDSEMLICEQCGKHFTHKGNFLVHLKRHSGLTPSVSKEYGRSLAGGNNLSTHMLCHGGLRNYVCEICGKRFKLATHLQTHFLVHSGEEPHMCEVCGKSYKQYGTLKTHMRTHSQEKPFRCELCGKSYPLKINLEIHIASHTGQKS